MLGKPVKQTLPREINFQRFLHARQLSDVTHVGMMGASAENVHCFCLRCQASSQFTETNVKASPRLETQYLAFEKTLHNGLN